MKTHHLFIAALCALVPFIQGCSNEDDINPNSNPDGCSVIFSLGVAGNGTTVSRASDIGHDMGQGKENEVKNVRIIIYDRPLNSEATAGGKVVKVLYKKSGLSASTGSQATASYYVSYYPNADAISTVDVNHITTCANYDNLTITNIDGSDFKLGQRYYAVAIANFGDDYASITEGMSLQSFRDIVYTGNLYNAAKISGDLKYDFSIYDNFRMSGINEVSFVWKPDANGVIDLCPNNGRFLVQRLAARMDITLGVKDVDYRVGSDNRIYLKVYNEDGNKLTYYDNSIEKDIEFILNDISLVNTRTNTSGVYLFERSHAQGSTKNIYLGNENWDKTDKTYANNIIVTPTGSVSETYSFVNKAGFTIPATVKSSGQLWTIIGNDNNKVNGVANTSIIGYMVENVTSDSYYTQLKISGWIDNNANTAEIFTPKMPSRANPENASDWKAVSAEIPIRHSIPSSNEHSANPMEKAVVRNTIYRLSIKVYAYAGKIYFRYYFYGDYTNELSTNPYPDNNKTPMDPNVGEGNGSNIND